MNALDESRLLVVDLEQTGHRVGVLFRHRKFKDAVLDLRTCKKFLNGVTHCEVYLEITVQGEKKFSLCAVGFGLCKWPDQYNRKIGRKRSLTSALLKKAKGVRLFNHAERAAIWNAYWAQKTASLKATVIEAEVLVPRLSPIQPVHVAGTQLDVNGNMMGGL